MKHGLWLVCVFMRRVYAVDSRCIEHETSLELCILEGTGRQPA